MASPITRLLGHGLSYDVQADLIGVNSVSLRRWEVSNGIPAHERMLLVAFAEVCERDPALASEVPTLLKARGVLYTLHRLLTEAVSTVDT